MPRDRGNGFHVRGVCVLQWSVGRRLCGGESRGSVWVMETHVCVFSPSDGQVLGVAALPGDVLHGGELCFLGAVSCLWYRVDLLLVLPHVLLQIEDK